MKTLYNNPIVWQRADLWVYRHTDGHYYLTGSIPGHRVVELRRAKSLDELEHAASLIVRQAHKEGPMNELIWTSEVHYINGKWYICLAVSNRKTIRNESHHHRMFTFENQHIGLVNTDWIEKE